MLAQFLVVSQHGLFSDSVFDYDRYKGAKLEGAQFRDHNTCRARGEDGTVESDAAMLKDEDNRSKALPAIVVYNKLRVHSSQLDLIISSLYGTRRRVGPCPLQGRQKDGRVPLVELLIPSDRQE